MLLVIFISHHGPSLEGCKLEVQSYVLFKTNLNLIEVRQDIVLAIVCWLDQHVFVSNISSHHWPPSEVYLN